MRNLPNGLLPLQYPDLTFICLAHEGKSDLDMSIPRKLRAWREPGVRLSSCETAMAATVCV